MNEPVYTVRNYRTADFREYSRLCISQGETTGLKLSRQEIAEQLNRPGFSAGKDLFVADTGGRIIGYAHLTPETGIDRVNLRSWIEPSHRRRGLAREFLNRIIRRTGELGINAVHVGVFQDNRTAREALPKLGFRYIRRYLEMELAVTRVPQEKLEEACERCRKLRQGEEKIMMEIQNRAFAGHWGYNPNTLETIIWDINYGSRSPEDVVLACEGDAVAGYCWTELAGDSITHGGDKRGTINMIGVAPEHRGEGLGKKVLLAGIAYLKSRGAGRISLTVDAENSIAWEMYRAVGFEETGSTLWYEKIID